ncbi:metallophosphoesterase, partial [Candidatus Woesearchaeota archaeon]|nr:metallophosphoesterase [Candidatus Woesearchaeota archaeon]
MRALIMSDLHAMGERFLLPEEKFDYILLCGDNAETDKGFPYHHALFKDIREQFSGPVGFVVGNHD